MKRLILLSAACLIAVSILMFSTISGSAPRASKEPGARVALFAENETGSFFLQIKSGAQDAAESLNAQLTVEIIDRENLDQQIAGLAEDHIAAIVFAQDAALTADALSILKAHAVRSVTIDQASGDRAVLRDTAADARTLADWAAGYSRVLIVGGEADGLRAALTGARQGECVALSAPESAAIARAGDIIVALTAESARSVMAQKAAGDIPTGIPLLAVDTGETRAADLESGMVQGMLLPQPYAIGYLALQTALEPGGARSVYAASKLVTPERMYLPENVDIVFPLLQ